MRYLALISLVVAMAAVVEAQSACNVTCPAVSLQLYLTYTFMAPVLVRALLELQGVLDHKDPLVLRDRLEQ